MYNNKMNLLSAVLSLSLIMMSFANAQTPSRFLTLAPPSGFPIIPVLEGWIANEDGSRSFSYGFVNRNTDLAVDIPIGENNYMEPSEFNGMQPTHFPPGRSRGVFTVTVPEDQRDISVWWHIKTGEAEELKIPGRAREAAYELDFIRPRPQGSLQPLAGFGEDGPQAAGLQALIEDYPGSVRVGTPVTLTINARDPSVRDPSDPRFVDPLPVSLHWFKHQGAGNVEFTRHESTVVAGSRADEDDDEVNIGADVNIVRLAEGVGIARIIATFSEPGEYLLRTLVENYRAPDSSPGNQCCWTNVYQRINVTP
jgi:hypothetical protein